MATVRDVTRILQEIAPDDLAESWDNVGLLVGNPNQEIQRILLALDPSLSLLKEATAINADLIITHHPVIFHPLKAIRTDEVTGQLLNRAIRENISIIGCHTNFDSAAGGVSEILATQLSLKQSVPLLASHGSGQDTQCGLGRIGTYQSPVTAEEFLRRLSQVTRASWLLEAGIRPETVSRIAVCGGSCSDFAPAALQQGADVFVTAEVKHAAARWAEDAGLWLIDGGHFATENLAITFLQEKLQTQLSKENLKLEVVCAKQTPPLRLVEDYI